MQPDSRARLNDMLTAARAALRYVQGADLEKFEADELLRDAVYHRLMIVGEALSVVRRTDEATAERVTDWHRIIGFRNQIVHGYAILRHSITWKIVTERLPLLITELEALLAE